MGQYFGKVTNESMDETNEGLDDTNESSDDTNESSDDTNESSDDTNESSDDTNESSDDTTSSNECLDDTTALNESVEESVRVWQCEELLCGTALHAVFAWLAPEELARAGAACRAWRRAAAEPALWRRHLLRAGAAPAALHALKQHDESVSWRQEYVTACAGWRYEGKFLDQLDTILCKTLLAPHGRLLAVSGVLTLTILELSDGKWCQRWSVEMIAFGMTSMYRLVWNDDASRLMAFGGLADNEWEADLLVFQVDDGGETKGGSVLARLHNIAEAFWNTCDTFISLVPVHVGYNIELPSGCYSVSWTNVYLHSLSEESYGENAESELILRLYDENYDLYETICMQGFVVDAPNDIKPPCDNVDIEYLRATQHSGVTLGESTRVLVANFGTWIRSWLLEALTIPGADPSEYDGIVKVRAACTQPAYEVRLQSQPYELTTHPSKRCAWIATCDGSVTCVSLPTLRILRVLTSPDEFDLHNCCLHITVTPTYIASSNGGTCWPRCRVRTWSTRTGASGPLIETSALRSVTPLSEDRLIFVTDDSGMQLYRSLATRQSTLQELDSTENTS